MVKPIEARQFGTEGARGSDNRIVFQDNVHFVIPFSVRYTESCFNGPA
jgi:hypothetical protein